jgi:hypothetical protein
MENGRNCGGERGSAIALTEATAIATTRAHAAPESNASPTSAPIGRSGRRAVEWPLGRCAGCTGYSASLWLCGRHHGMATHALRPSRANRGLGTWTDVAHDDTGELQDAFPVDEEIRCDTGMLVRAAVTGREDHDVAAPGLVLGRWSRTCPGSWWSGGAGE